MKGVILAGGKGTRLHPLTKSVNKHLLPIYDKPMIYYPIETMIKGGVRHIMIICGPEHIDNFVKLLGSGQDFHLPDGKQLQIVYGIQNEPKGIAQGLWIAKEYIGDDNCVLCLGDNLFEDDFSSAILNFKKGAQIFLKEVKDPERFGVAEMSKDQVVSIEEKPSQPKSNLAITGFYIFDNSVFKKIEKQDASRRGEYEITWTLEYYMEEGKVIANKVIGEWFDAGTIESLHKASSYFRNKIM